jgi:hypothetical protein
MPRNSHRVIGVHRGGSDFGAGDRLCDTGVKYDRSAGYADPDVPSKAFVDNCGSEPSRSAGAVARSVCNFGRLSLKLALLW